MVDPVTAWRTDHFYFRQLLHLLQEQLDLLHQDEEPAYDVMVDIVSYLRDYVDRSHHPREDVAFARLANYCPNMELVVARLQQEHRVIAHTGNELVELLQAVMSGEIVPREQIEALTSTYLVYYNGHLAKEDGAVIDSAAHHLTDADWQAVKNAAPLHSDPLFGQQPEARYLSLREYVVRAGLVSADSQAQRAAKREAQTA
ncbi:MAG TPA: hemerythrin domain-containing protein [Burkholderiaceae bacterium]|nr:hemerythrin domain-containing protein [Burkholderiaceae bacterium]